jgi:hypothetical protein
MRVRHLATIFPEPLRKARFLQRRPRAILTHATLPAPRAPDFISDRNSAEEPVSPDPLWYKDVH